MEGRHGRTLLYCVLIVVAIALSLSLWNRQETRASALQLAQTELEESQATWQRISAEKETLERSRSEAENDLRETSLALQESLEKAESIRAQLAELNVQREEKEQNAAAFEQEADMLSGLLLELQNADRALQNAYQAVEGKQLAQDAQEWNGLRVALRDALLSRRAALEWLIGESSMHEDPEGHSDLCLLLVDTEARLGELEFEDDELS